MTPGARIVASVIGELQESSMSVDYGDNYRYPDQGTSYEDNDKEDSESERTTYSDYADYRDYADYADYLDYSDRSGQYDIRDDQN